MKKEQTIAQVLNIKEFPFEIKDKNGKKIYYEDSTGLWNKREYDHDGNITYFENSNGFWEKYEYDSNGNEIYYESSNGYWYEYEYDADGKEIYYENSEGEISDNRPKDVILSMDDIAKKFKIDIKNLKIKQ